MLSVTFLRCGRSGYFKSTEQVNNSERTDADVIEYHVGFFVITNPKTESLVEIATSVSF